MRTASVFLLYITLLIKKYMYDALSNKMMMTNNCASLKTDWFLIIYLHYMKGSPKNSMKYFKS